MENRKIFGSFQILVIYTQEGHMSNKNQTNLEYSYLFNAQSPLQSILHVGKVMAQHRIHPSF
jgi:hypothetical protein